MDDKTFSISLEKNPIISIEVTPGHFSTGHFHTNYFLDVSTLKANSFIARDVARELALPYLSSTLVDTIVCMENTKVIGAFMAQELFSEGTSIMNSGDEIYVVTPMNSTDGKLTFYDNEVEWIRNRHIILLTTTLSSGRTVSSALECLSQFNGVIAGISALFQFKNAMPHLNVNTLFTSDDIPGYNVIISEECQMCKNGQKLDALISSEGYKKI